MKLVTFSAPHALHDSVGVLRGEEVVDLPATARALGQSLPDSMLGLLSASGGDARAVAQLLERADRSGAARTVPLATVTLRAPIPRPGKIVGVGLNYVEHVAESHRTLDTDADLPPRPVLFDKPTTAVVGPDCEIRHDGTLTAQLDWEVELAVVIGRHAYRVAAEDAFDYVFGYSIVNDISARDQRRSGQWFFSKGQDSYAPLGPVLVTADEIADPQDLDLRLRVNGVTKQDSNTRHMLFKIPELIADITSGVTLEPGDVIATGSPSGVGAGHRPPHFLQPGDVVEAEVDGIGVLRNRVVDAAREPLAAVAEVASA
ncbi:MAG TPA: fumarylacetoacetate hydrolase family protein [Conexibacter sp.]|nr:fumarylacetoacetate hydrolase family protein [Conexibacter sp.]